MRGEKRRPVLGGGIHGAELGGVDRDVALADTDAKDGAFDFVRPVERAVTLPRRQRARLLFLHGAVVT